MLSGVAMSSCYGRFCAGVLVGVGVVVAGGEVYNEWLRVAVCMRSRYTISVKVLL